MAAAANKDSQVASRALADLCSTYWYPLYVFLRRKCHNVDEAEDLTQAFFAKLLERDFLANVDREKGRFRSFLLASLKHFLDDVRDHATALKRGGGKSIISLDAADAESRYQHEPADEMSPEHLFERQWALSLLEKVLSRLQAESTTASRGAAFETLQGALTGQRDVPYAEIATKLGMTEGAVKTAVHRLRQRYRELLIEEISLTVATPEDVSEEIRYLMSSLQMR
jgi:RNA polymerase sigma factor (sigma-70 family)